MSETVCAECGMTGGLHLEACPVENLRLDLAEARQQIKKLEARLEALEADTPQSRQLQYEADLAAADLAASGYRDGEEW
jgi:uncharacterized protein YigA (DUF484 family)